MKHIRNKLILFAVCFITVVQGKAVGNQVAGMNPDSLQYINQLTKVTKLTARTKNYFENLLKVYNDLVNENSLSGKTWNANLETYCSRAAQSGIGIMPLSHETTNGLVDLSEEVNKACKLKNREKVKPTIVRLFNHVESYHLTQAIVTQANVFPKYDEAANRFDREILDRQTPPHVFGTMAQDSNEFWGDFETAVPQLMGQDVDGPANQ